MAPKSPKTLEDPNDVRALRAAMIEAYETLKPRPPTEKPSDSCRVMIWLREDPSTCESAWFNGPGTEEGWQWIGDIRGPMYDNEVLAWCYAPKLDAGRVKP